MYLAEFSIIGFLAGVAGTSIAWIAVGLVWKQAFGGGFVSPGWSLLVAIATTVLLANAGGWSAAMAYFRRRPLEVLRGE